MGKSGREWEWGVGRSGKEWGGVVRSEEEAVSGVTSIEGCRVPAADGARPFLLQRRDLQQMTSGLIADPASAAIALAMYAEIDQAGSANIASAIIARFYELGAPISLQPMST